MGDLDFNVTEALAGIPELMRRYEQGTAVQRAIVHAGVDARRLGSREHFTMQYFRDAAPGYLAGGSAAIEANDAIDAALDDLIRRTGPADRSTAPLLLVNDANNPMGWAADIADYLYEHLSARRRAERVPSSVWETLIRGVSDPVDAARLMASALDRLLYCYALPLRRRFADAGIQLHDDRLDHLLGARNGSMNSAAWRWLVTSRRPTGWPKFWRHVVR